MAQEIKMSAAGLKAMQEELEYLKTVRRKELAEEIKEVPNKNGSGTYTAYVKFDFDKMQPRSYRNNPDIKQAKEQIPTNENKVQVAVNDLSMKENIIILCGHYKVNITPI